MTYAQEENTRGCQRCGEIARKISAPVEIRDGDRWIYVCQFCAATRWWVKP